MLGDGADPAEEVTGERVLGEDVAEIADDLGAGVGEAVEEEQQAGAGVVAGEPSGGRAVSGEGVEVVAFVVAEVKGAGERGEELRRRLGAATLFEAAVVVGGHASELGDFFAPEAGGASAGACGQADVGRGEAFASATQEVGELAAGVFEPRRRGRRGNGAGR